MANPNLNFDPKAVAMKDHVCDEAWRKLQATTAFPTPAMAQLNPNAPPMKPASSAPTA